MNEIETIAHKVLKAGRYKCECGDGGLNISVCRGCHLLNIENAHACTLAYAYLRLLGQYEDLKDAAKKSIERADDYGDSYVTKPIRIAVKNV